MWIRIKDKITYTNAWYKDFKGEIFEVDKTDAISGIKNDFYYCVKTEDKKYFYIDSLDVDIVELRREKINKIKKICGLK